MTTEALRPVLLDLWSKGMPVEGRRGPATAVISGTMSPESLG